MNHATPATHHLYPIIQRVFHLLCTIVFLLIITPPVAVQADITKPGAPTSQPIVHQPNSASVVGQATNNQTNRTQASEFSGIRFHAVTAASATLWDSINPGLPTPRTDMQVAVGPSGNIFTFGGWDQNGQVTNVVEAYFIREKKWHCSTGNPASTCDIHDLAPLPTARAAMAGAMWINTDNYFFLAGGVNAANQVMDIVEVYSFQEKGWYCSVGDLSCPESLRIVAPLGTARAFAVGVTGPDGAPYVLGGTTGNNTVTGDVETWNPSTRLWEQRPDLPTPRAALGAITEMRTESIFLIGGNADNVTFTPVDTVEVYHVPTGTWTCSQNRPGCQQSNHSGLPTPRSDMAVVAGFDGRLYAVGGAQGQVIMNTVEVYDPSTATWSTGTSLPTARAAASAVASPIDGQLYVLGGQHSIQFSSIVNTVEAFTPPPPQDPEQGDVQDRAYPSTYLPVSQLLLTRAEEYEGYPTNTIFGNYTRQDTDLSMPGYGPEIRITRTYNSAYPIWGPFGWGWNATYEMYALDVGSAVVVIQHDGRRDTYLKENGRLIAPPGAVDQLIDNGDGTLILTTRDRLVYRFSGSRLASVQDPDGNTVTLEYSGGNWTAIQDASGRRWTLSYNAEGLVSQIENPAGQVVRYTYNDRAELIAVTDPTGNVMRYVYDNSGHHQMLEVYDGNDHLVVANAYTGTVDEETGIYYGRIERQADSRSENFIDDIHTFLYAGGVTAYVDPTGAVSGSVYDANYQLRYKIDSLGDVSAFGYPDADVLASQNIQSGQNLLVSQETNGNDGKTQFTYDTRGNLATITDPLGNETRMAYDARDNLIRETDPLGNQTTWVYDAQDNLLSMTNAAGNTTTYTYDANGQRTSMTDALGNTTRYEVDTHGNRTAVIDPLSNTTRFTYYPTGQVKTETDPLGHTTSYTYDARNLPLTVTAPDGGVTRSTYDAAGNRLTVTDPLGNVTTSTYNEANDLMAETDALGNTTRYEYDSMGREIKRALPDGGVWTTGYDENGRKQWEASPLCNANSDCAPDPIFHCLQDHDNCQMTFWAYDANGNLVTNINAALQVTDYVYDANDRLIEMNDPQSNITRYTYDAAGNRISMTDANGNRPTYRYDQLNRLVGVTNPLGHTETTVYDALGRVISTTNGAGETVARSYDALGRVLTITAADINIQFTYDAVGNRLSMTDDIGTTTYIYDALDRLTSVDGPHGQVRYGYDLAGNRTMLNQPGAEITYGYDARNQLSNVTLDGESLITYSYDSVGRTASQAFANNVATAKIYDLAGRLTGITTNGPSGTLQEINYTLDVLGNRTVEESTDFAATYSYDTLSQLTGTTINFAISNPVTATPTATPTPTSTATPTTVPSPASTPAPSPSPTDPLPKPTKAETPAPTSETTPPAPTGGGATPTLPPTSPPTGTNEPIATSAFQVSLPVVLMGGARVSNAAQADPLIADQNDSVLEIEVSAGQITYAYTYDAVGNRTASVENGVNTAYQYDAANRLTTAGNQTVSYDAAGRLTNDGVNQYSYNALDRLTAISGKVAAAFLYDGDNNRVSETVQGISHTYLIDTNGALPVRLAATSNGNGERYIYGNERFVQVTSDGSWHYEHQDGLGNVRLLTNGGGAVVNTSAYAPFGKRLAGSGSFGFTSEPDIADGLLVHLRARDYSPALGRFLTMDPFPPDAMEPRMFNAFIYGLNKTVNLTDPTGFCIGYPCGAASYTTLSSAIAPPTFNTTFGVQQPYFSPQPSPNGLLQSHQSIPTVTFNTGIAPTIFNGPTTYDLAGRIYTQITGYLPGQPTGFVNVNALQQGQIAQNVGLHNNQLFFLHNSFSNWR